MFIFLEYTAIVALALLGLALLFAFSAALLMVEEGFEVALRMLRTNANTTNTLDEGSGLRRRMAHATLKCSR